MKKYKPVRRRAEDHRKAAMLRFFIIPAVRYIIRFYIALRKSSVYVRQIIIYKREVEIHACIGT